MIHLVFLVMYDDVSSKNQSKAVVQIFTSKNRKFQVKHDNAAALNVANTLHSNTTPNLNVFWCRNIKENHLQTLFLSPHTIVYLYIYIYCL